jgi:peptidoglycan/LPS O-acetylase OafA/YrhL
MKQMRDYRIDSLRGIAVLSVVLHHLFQFSNPAGKNSSIFENFFIKNGQYGVELFFIISGYVIFTYFPTVNNLLKFMLLRYTRLIPMLIVAILVIFTLSLVIGDFSRQLILNGVLSALIIDPNLLGKIIGLNQTEWIDDSFWTLFVEVRFYIVYGLVFFLTKKKLPKYRLTMLIAVLVTAKIINILATYLDFQFLVKISGQLFFTQYSGYFIAGILISVGFDQKVKISRIFLMFSSLLIVTIWSVASYLDIIQTRRTPIIFPLILTICFLIVFMSPSRFNQYLAKGIGAPSYVAYVLHLGVFTFIFTENPKVFDNSIDLFALLIIFFGISYLIHNFIEIRLIKGLRQFLSI